MNRRKLKVEVGGKVNLSLNITGRELSLHRLDSVVASVSVADAVTVCERFDGRVNVEFIAPFAVPEENSVTKTLHILREKFGPLGADVLVEKGLPLAGGMGGSSADCAAVILAMNTLFDLPFMGHNPFDTAKKAGSDVPYMLTGGYCRMAGTGEILSPFGVDVPLHLVLCCGTGEGVSSAVCYARFDALYPGGSYAPADNDALIAALTAGDRQAAAKQMRNALTEPSCTLQPQITQTLRRLSALPKAEAVTMTGSGSVCVALMPDRDSALSAQCELEKEGFWARAVQTVADGIRFV